MRWYTTSGLVVLTWMLAAGCGGDDDKEGMREEAAGTVKLDGKRLSGCFSNADCEGDLSCYGANTSSMDATAGYCADPCNPDVEEDPFSPLNRCADIGKLAATCSPEGQCRVDCTGGGMGDGDCPAGMECRDLDPSDMNAFRCAYPIGTARGNKKAWEECNPSRGDADCGSPNVCVAFGNGQNRRGFCSAPCTADEECTAPGGVTARPLCAATLEACSLDCADGASCPGGMECVDTSPGQMVTMRCRFVPAGAQQGGDMPAGEMPPQEMMSGGA